MQDGRDRHGEACDGQEGCSDDCHWLPQNLYARSCDVVLHIESLREDFEAMMEQVSALKANVDTLTLTATPIPRTLQFSLMGARDLSIIRTPPPNRHPVDTIITGFNEEVIRDAIAYELSRGGQVYFVHNRVGNIQEVAGMIQRLVPDARIGIGHGQMEGKDLENVMARFIDGAFDVLVATTIIESGIDISNANTILIRTPSPPSSERSIDTQPRGNPLKWDRTQVQAFT